MRGAAAAPNSPRDIGVGLVKPRAIIPDIASKSKLMQTRWDGMVFPLASPRGLSASRGEEFQQVLGATFRITVANVVSGRVVVDQLCIGNAIAHVLVDTGRVQRLRAGRNDQCRTLARR